MNIEEIREYCLAKKRVIESFPFDNETLVFKVMDKLFVLTNLEGDLSINLKCDPETAIQLRVQYPSVLPGYHMNKKYWNLILIDGSVNDQLIYQWIDQSYQLVVEKLTKKQKEELDKL
ncbi:MAG: MmcQ-like protein [Bacteroidetes bacterium HGW-Bacteroidetes-17]|jgi:predicted DNA-binding protein (MmcQ/YjbR family)|nr:MAG: MmcQ-like protein [Bacteroidetes bacterium HGW-Bacteroidetes-17]